jgi:hypothetical protein
MLRNAVRTEESEREEQNDGNAYRINLYLQKHWKKG